MPKIAVIPFHYRRPENLQYQLEAIENQTLKPNEIIIGHLVSEEFTPDYNFPDKYKVVKFHQDPGLCSKFITALASDFDTDFVAILDDDIIPGERYLENVVNCFNEKPGLYGGLGFKLTANNWYKHWGSSEPPPHGQNPDIREVDFIGHSWFLKREWLAHFFQQKCPLDVFSGTDDIWISFQCWKQGIPSYVPPYAPDKKEVWPDKEIRSLSDDRTLNQYYNSHISDRKQIIKHAKEQGWPE